MNIDQLNEAFNTFTAASKSLETSYGLLKERVTYLTTELEIRNQQLKAALDDAEKNKDYLKAVLYNLEEAIIVVDPEGRVTMMNRSAEDLLGTALHEAIGTLFSSFAVSIRAEDTETILDAGKGRHAVILSRSDVVDAEGYLRGSVILIKDITRLRELELRHERNQRLIAMGEMAAKIVHEIRNPLCSIELFSSMLEKDLTSSVHKDLARGISTGIGNLNTILTNMLFFAKPNKSIVSKIWLNAVIEESIRMLLPMMESRNVQLRHKLRECEISGDAELLKQVFLNILINAVQAMPDGGELAVTMEDEVDAVVVNVKDTGAGIAREYLEKIFDPFFTTKDNGTGLGLAIVNTIMQANGAYIRAASEQGKGSTFSLSFPTGRMTDKRRWTMNETDSERGRDSSRHSLPSSMMIS
jgi:signal transduction histidine kinase